MTTDTDVRTLFASGIDYWQRKHHTHHSLAMKKVLLTLLLVAQRMGVHAVTSAQSNDRHMVVRHPLPLLPEELWLEVLGFLRSSDFTCCANLSKNSDTDKKLPNPARGETGAEHTC